MTEAFGTIKRTKLMEILESFLRQDKVRFIRMLFSNTILDIKSSSNCNNIFHTNIDCWQGDSLFGYVSLLHTLKKIYVLSVMEQITTM